MKSLRWVDRLKPAKRPAGLDRDAAPPPPAGQLATLADLDEKIAQCDGSTSDDELRQLFGTFHMQPPVGVPDDPFSPEYRDFQLEFYRQLAGKPYDVVNEATVFDVADAVRRPFPFSTGSCLTTGESLIGTGFILRAMNLAPGSRVLELGAGWGTMTMALAMLGHRVTAVDVEPRFCDLLARRAAHDGLSVTVVNADFNWVRETGEQFDAVLFTSAFHHAADHLELLGLLHNVLAPNGRVFFASEPIQPDLPYPWGLRLDGQSLWSIRKHGWLELGFTERYFAAALGRTGWVACKHAAKDPEWLKVFEAHPRASARFRFTAEKGLLGTLSTQVGLVDRGSILLDRAPAGAAMFGPYACLLPGRYVAHIGFNDEVPRRGTARMDIAVDAGTRQLAECRIDVAALPDAGPVATLAFASDSELNLLEVRLFCSDGFAARIEAVEIVAAA